ncbi:MAG: hypothetical protein FWD23_03855 [Oscillospiraceae bacterium]|nr:hypothetical protein [Oscillospiraceae bacterium]
MKKKIKSAVLLPVLVVVLLLMPGVAGSSDVFFESFGIENLYNPFVVDGFRPYDFDVKSSIGIALYLISMNFEGSGFTEEDFADWRVVGPVPTIVFERNEICGEYYFLMSGGVVKETVAQSFYNGEILCGTMGPLPEVNRYIEEGQDFVLFSVGYDTYALLRDGTMECTFLFADRFPEWDFKYTSKEMSLLSGKNNAEIFAEYFTSIADIKSGALDFLDADEYLAIIERSGLNDFADADET